jgi:hypothetical protein
MDKAQRKHGVFSWLIMERCQHCPSRRRNEMPVRRVQGAVRPTISSLGRLAKPFSTSVRAPVTGSKVTRFALSVVHCSSAGKISTPYSRLRRQARPTSGLGESNGSE